MKLAQLIITLALILNGVGLIGAPSKLGPDPAWFVCVSKDDCALARGHCTYVAVNTKYTDQFTLWSDSENAAIGPTFHCIENMEQIMKTMSADCIDSKCELVPIKSPNKSLQRTGHKPARR